MKDNRDIGLDDIGVVASFREADAEQRATLKRGRWGQWQLLRDLLVLRHVRRGYDVDLEQIEDAASLLDAVCHVAEKAWPGPYDATADLLRALNFLFEPQERMCAGERIDPRATLLARFRAIEGAGDEQRK